MPQRIQRKRTRGFKMPTGAIYVGRPTKWGNPFRLQDFKTREQCVEAFRRKIESNRWTFPSVFDIRRELRGKDLACWCPLVDKDRKPVACHADVLIAIANS